MAVNPIGQQPGCQITGPLARTITPRLISLTLTDRPGAEADSLSIRLDGQGIDHWPETGSQIGCLLGYQDRGLIDMGTFRLQRVSQSLSPNIITLHASSVRFDRHDPTELKQNRHYSWQRQHLAAIAHTLASRHGLSLRINEQLGQQWVEQCDQAGEPDLAFLQRLARRYDALCKPVGSLLVLAPHGQLDSISGQPLTEVAINIPQPNPAGSPAFISATVQGSEKQQFSGVSAHWYDQAHARQRTEQTGSPPRQLLSLCYASQPEARTAIQAQLRSIQRMGDRLQLECPGDPQLAAEGLLLLNNTPIERMAGRWSIDSVSHHYDGGYRCSLDASRPAKTS